MVILPKKYTILGEEKQSYQERAFYIDSLNFSSGLPSDLIEFLKQGESFKVQHPGRENFHYERIPACFPDIEVVGNPEVSPQQRNGIDCGWWAFYNALMLVFTGGNTFLEKFDKPPVDPEHKAYYLRYLFPDIGCYGEERKQFFDSPNKNASDPKTNQKKSPKTKKKQDSSTASNGSPQDKSQKAKNQANGSTINSQTSDSGKTSSGTLSKSDGYIMTDKQMKTNVIEARDEWVLAMMLEESNDLVEGNGSTEVHSLVSIEDASDED